MLRYCNININGDNKVFKYLVKYDNSLNSIMLSEDYGVIEKENYIYFKYKDLNNLYKINGNFIEIEDDGAPQINSKSIQLSVLFPEYSIETYDNHYSYVLTIKTSLCDKDVCLGSFLLNRYDSLALNRIKLDGAEKYYEYISVNIIDPYDLCYGDDWTDFRKKLLGIDDESDEPNSYNVVLNVSLTPVIMDESYRMDKYLDGQSCMNIYMGSSDYLNLDLQHNTNRELKYQEEPSFICKLDFNKSFNGDAIAYFKDTYEVSLTSVKYNLIIGTENDMHYDHSIIKTIDNGLESCSFTKTDIGRNGNFTGWLGWQEGMCVRASACMQVNGSEEEFLYIMSNSVPFTKELYKYFLNDGYPINNIKLNNIDMINYQINAVNKIHNKIVRVEKNLNNVKNVKITNE